MFADLPPEVRRSSLQVDKYANRFIDARHRPSPSPERDDRIDEATQEAWAREDTQDAKADADKKKRKRRKAKAMKSQDTTPGLPKKKKKKDDDDPDAAYKPTGKVQKGYAIYTN